MTDKPPKTIVITGATRGLGRALAEEYLRQRHRVAGCGRNEKKVAELKGLEPPEHSDFRVLDVTNDMDMKSWAQYLLKKWGPPDLLINNAAIVNRLAPLWEQEAREMEDLLSINLGGVVNAIRHFVPAMVTRNRGVIVNLSSGWGRSVSPEVAPYCMSKWAIEGLSKALALELPKGMASIPLSPGIVHTDMLESVFGITEAKAYPRAKEWAEKAAPFILSLSARHSGESLTVPGIPED